MKSLNDVVSERLAVMEAKNQRRVLRPTRRGAGAVTERAGKTLISFSCNDYLGLSHHAGVIAAAQAAVAEYGAGAGASRLVTGDCLLYAELEKKLAAHHGAEAALVFGSGYLANIGVIPALMQRGDVIFSDRLAHACLLDGARLSGADMFRFAHNDMAHLRELLAAQRGEYPHALIVVDAVYSMDGDCAPMAEILALAEEHDAWVLVDGAHDLHATQAHPAMVYVGTLSKAFGAYGGYVTGSRAVVDYLSTAARTLIYTTGLPPAVLGAAIAALQIIQEQPELSEIPLRHARNFTAALGLPPAQSQIVPLLVGEEETALNAARALEGAGFLVSAIRPPTVPAGTARLRFSFSAAHTDAQVSALIDAIRAQGGWKP